MKRKRIIIMIAVLFLAIALAALIRKRKHELSVVRPPKAYTTVVHAAQVNAGELDLDVRYLGEIVPVTESKIISKVSGFIENIFVDEGDRVNKGDILVKIDDREIRERIRQTDALILSAKNNHAALKMKIPGLESAANTNKGIFDRNKILYSKKAIGREELDISEKNYRMALSELDATRKSILALKSSIDSLKAQKAGEAVLLDYTMIKSPFTGIVSKRTLSAGDLVAPGKTILQLVCPDDGVKVVVHMAPEDFTRIKTGARAELSFNGKRMAAAVSAIYPSAGRESLGICNIRLPRSPFDLPYHARIETRLLTGRATGLIAPLSCLLRHQDKPLVVLIDSRDEAQVIPVEIIGKNEKYFCFKSAGIKPGDRLVSARESRLMKIFSGEKVEVMETS